MAENVAGAGLKRLASCFPPAAGLGTKEMAGSNKPLAGQRFRNVIAADTRASDAPLLTETLAALPAALCEKISD